MASDNSELQKSLRNIELWPSFPMYVRCIKLLLKTEIFSNAMKIRELRNNDIRV